MIELDEIIHGKLLDFLSTFHLGGNQISTRLFSLPFSAPIYEVHDKTFDKVAY